MITNLVALLITTNAMRAYCDICDTTNMWKYAVYHEHKIEWVVTTNYLPVVQMPVEVEVRKNPEEDE